MYFVLPVLVSNQESRQGFKQKGYIIFIWRPSIVKKFQTFYQISRKKPMKLPRNLADF
jgi:hypothetical protein